MNAPSKLSGKGQVVVPKEVRDRLGWLPGDALDVVEGDDSVTFRRRQRKTLTVKEAVARFRELYQHQGPPVSIEQMTRDAQEMATRRFDRT